jgi:hypothetical protein
MVTRLLKSRRSEPTETAEEIAARLRAEVLRSPLGEEMQYLRELRDAGRITPAEYAVEAAAVLQGTSRRFSR